MAYLQGMERGAQALDWGAVLERLADHARTLRGAAAAARLDFAADRGAALERYAQVAEVQAIEGSGDLRVPVGEVGDIAEAVARAGRGVQLDIPDLREIGASLAALDALRRFLGDRSEASPALWGLVEPHGLDSELLWRLGESFDEDGQLSGRLYPELAELRGAVAAIRRRIRATLDELVRGEALAGALQDRFVTERGGRFVLPIKSSRRAGIGIVHDTSQSGETVFVEPAAVVEQHNKLKEVEGQLRREERRILVALSALVGRHAAAVLEALDAAVRVDLACARAALGDELDGILPELGRGGVIDLKRGRHPVLQLRGVEVVPNDLHLSGERPALVLTGPNTGGKTVAMKTLGLAALCARAGIPVAADEGSRVDFFDPILASAGDLQSVEGDLSTFSGQVLVLRDVLSSAGPGALVLLDEIAVGTDPAQGAALARAVLEAVVGAGARLCVTTHYTELKALAEVDGRFAVGAMAYEDGAPTYRLRHGAVGQSHALSTAARFGLPPAVLRRARELLGGGRRELGELLDRLEAERLAVSREGARLRREAAALREREAALAEERERLRQRAAALRREVAGDWAERIAEREREIVALIAALQADPSLRRAGGTLEQIRALRRAAEEEVRAPAAPAAPPTELAVGDRVRVRTLGKEGVVTAISGRRVTVRVGRMQVRARWAELEGVTGERYRAPKASPPPPERAAGFGAVRTGGNTCDLRGLRVDAALERAGKFLDELTLRGEPAAYILHGHGTGALKEAVRGWLPGCGYARSWRPGDEAEGGDAWTVVSL